jgi:shikimate kinase
MKLFLIGMMGSGKSYWGRQLQELFKIDFFDLDLCIEEENGERITEIFSIRGEEYFRDYESKKLKEFGEYSSFILATGGGTPCFHNNMQWMNDNGITIWIDESVDVLTQRLMTEKAHRPLLKNLNDNELQLYLTNKLKERASFYSQSQYHLQGENINEQQFINIIKQHA